MKKEVELLVIGNYITAHNYGYDKIISIKGKKAITENGKQLWIDKREYVGSTYHYRYGRSKRSGFYEVGNTGFDAQAYSQTTQELKDKRERVEMKNKLSVSFNKAEDLTNDQMNRIKLILEEQTNHPTP